MRRFAALAAVLLAAGCQSGPEHASEILPEDVEAADHHASAVAERVLAADWCAAVDADTVSTALGARDVLVHRAERRHLYNEHLEHDAAGCVMELVIAADGGTAEVPRVTGAVADVAAVPCASVDDTVELFDVYLNGAYLEYVQQYEQESQPDRDALLEGGWIRDMDDAAVLVTSVRDGGMYPGIWAWGLSRTDTVVIKVEVRIELDADWSPATIERRRAAAADLVDDLLRDAHATGLELLGD